MNRLDKIRRNHGLEHATISTLLSHPKTKSVLAGYSTHRGFVIIGQVEHSVVSECVERAIHRIEDGEPELAISAYCGTNIIVSAALASIGAVLAIRSFGTGMPGLTRTFTHAVIAIIAGRPLGRFVQSRYTTSPDVQNLQIRSMTHHRLGNLDAHWIATEFS